MTLSYRMVCGFSFDPASTFLVNTSKVLNLWPGILRGSGERRGYAADLVVSSVSLE